MKYNNRFTRSLLATAVAVALPGAAMAQLEEVIVTATKRAESLQDVPVSVVAASGESIADMAITKAEDLSSILPAITASVAIEVATRILSYKQRLCQH